MYPHVYVRVCVYTGFVCEMMALIHRVVCLFFYLFWFFVFVLIVLLVTLPVYFLVVFLVGVVMDNNLCMGLQL